MSARSENFPWPSHYGHFDFFENRMRSHSDVSSLKSCKNGVYEIRRQNGKTLRVFICECYAFGVAEYMEAVRNLGTLNAIIINSTWCGYSYEAKRYCRDIGVGLFKIVDFMAALNYDEFWNHLNKRETEVFEDKGWI